MEATPVTYTVLALSGISSFFFQWCALECGSRVSKAASAPARDAAFNAFVPIGWSGAVSRGGAGKLLRALLALPFCSIPFGMLDGAKAHMVPMVLCLLQYREIERRCGSGKFLALLLLSSVVGSLFTVLALRHTGVLYALQDPRVNTALALIPLELVQVLSSLGAQVVMAALDVHRYRLHSGRGHYWSVGVLYQLIVQLFYPGEVVIFQGRHPAQRVTLDSGLNIRYRLGARVVGLLLGWLTTPRLPGGRGGPLYPLVVAPLARYVTQPLCRRLRPLLHLLFGDPVVVKHYTTRRTQQEERLAAAVDALRAGAREPLDGRVRVDPLVGPAGALRRRGPLPPPRVVRPGPRGPASHRTPEQQAILTQLSRSLEEMGMIAGTEMAERELEAVLDSCDWRLDAAVDVILSTR